MQLARVCGQVVSTKKAEKLMGFKILVVQPMSLETFQETGSPIVALDVVGAGEGEVVMIVSGSSARQTPATDARPVDCSIVAIIDSVDILGTRRFDKAALPAENAREEQQTESNAFEQAEPAPQVISGSLAQAKDPAEQVQPAVAIVEEAPKVQALPTAEIEPRVPQEQVKAAPVEQTEVNVAVDEPQKDQPVSSAVKEKPKTQSAKKAEVQTEFVRLLNERQEVAEETVRKTPAQPPRHAKPPAKRGRPKKK